MCECLCTRGSDKGNVQDTSKVLFDVRQQRISLSADSVHATALVHVRTQGGALPLRELPWCSPGFDTHTPCRLTKHINKTRVPRECARYCSPRSERERARASRGRSENYLSIAPVVMLIVPLRLLLFCHGTSGFCRTGQWRTGR